jgi:hypothetical protein
MGFLVLGRSSFRMNVPVNATAPTRTARTPTREKGAARRKPQPGPHQKAETSFGTIVSKLLSSSLFAFLV